MPSRRPICSASVLAGCRCARYVQRGVSSRTPRGADPFKEASVLARREVAIRSKRRQFSHAAEVGDLLPAPGAGRSALRSSPHVHGEPCCFGPIHAPKSCRKKVPHLDDVPIGWRRFPEVRSKPQGGSRIERGCGMGVCWTQVARLDARSPRCARCDTSTRSLRSSLVQNLCKSIGTKRLASTTR